MSKVVQCDICKKSFDAKSHCVFHFKRNQWFWNPAYGKGYHINKFDICEECIAFIEERINNDRDSYERECQSAYKEALRISMGSKVKEKIGDYL